MLQFGFSTVVSGREILMIQVAGELRNVVTTVLTLLSVTVVSLKTRPSLSVTCRNISEGSTPMRLPTMEGEKQQVSVCHRVNDGIDSVTIGQAGFVFGIFGPVGELPCVGDIHVVADCHHHASATVVNSSP